MQLSNLATTRPAVRADVGVERCPSLLDRSNVAEPPAPFSTSLMGVDAVTFQCSGRQKSDFSHLSRILGWTGWTGWTGKAKSGTSCVQPYILSLDGLDRRDNRRFCIGRKREPQSRSVKLQD